MNQRTSNRVYPSKFYLFRKPSRGNRLELDFLDEAIFDFCKFESLMLKLKARCLSIWMEQQTELSEHSP